MVHVPLKTGLENFEYYFANKGPSSQGYGSRIAETWLGEF